MQGRNEEEGERGRHSSRLGGKRAEQHESNSASSRNLLTPRDYGDYVI